MSALSRLATSAASSLVRNRQHLPKSINRLIDDIAKNPDGTLARLASVLLGGRENGLAPPPTAAPDSPVRVYIGPTNYSGQGRLWAAALSASDPRIGARNMAVELPGGFAFPADTLVPIAVYNSSESWQRRELQAVELFTHVLIEAERPLFGRLFDRDVAREVALLRERGISCAYLSHGTDIRSPRRHAITERWSPFSADTEQNRLLQSDADRNLALLEASGLPVFVSTPDLLVELPMATWCPVVVDPTRWVGGREPFERDLPVVLHVPSMGAIKGTQLIEPTLRALHDEGIIDYRSVSGVASADMPALVTAADIVLDQFRIGSYGVAACEALAAGRVAIGHVSDSVRDSVRKLSGLELPIVEADPDTLRDVLIGLVTDKDAAGSTAALGLPFVQKVHSGAYSAMVLRDHWLDASA